jgi:CheY-specific phosphatase CheX
MAVQLYWVDHFEDNLIATLMAPLTRASVASLTGEIEKLFKPRITKNVILDFDKCPDQGSVSLNVLIANVARLIRRATHPGESGTRFLISGATEVLKNYIKTNGVASDLEFVSSFREHLRRREPKGKADIDMKFIEPFIAATRETISGMCSLSIESGELIPRNHAETRQYDLAALVVLKSDAFSGAIVIGFNKASYLKILSSMLGEEIQGEVVELADGASELLNIIYARAKKDLNEKGYGLKTAIPTLAHDYRPPENRSGLVLPMQFDGGSFIMEFLN